MVHQSDSSTRPLLTAALFKKMIWGGAIGLILITAFLLSAGEGNPAWPRFWMIRPLIIVPLAGAAGGGFFHFMGALMSQGGWKKVLAIVLSVLVYIFGLWIGTILGLDGTWWD